MADNNFRSDRSRDPLAHRSADAPAREAVDDPLAELARLIGQSATMMTTTDTLSPSRDYAAPAGHADWAADDRYAEQSDVDQEAYDQRYEQRYDERYDERREPPPLADPRLRSLLRCLPGIAPTRRHPPVSFPRRP